MKKLTVFTVLIVTITFVSCIKETLTVPNDFTASQGSYVGVVHIAYGYLDGQAIVYRFNEDNAQWEEISWTWSEQWDDIGWQLPNGIVPGKEYRYKMRLHTDDAGFSEYSNEITGYAFKGTGAEISSINREKDGDEVNITINWRDPNDLSEIKNVQDIYYDIYRTEDGNVSDYQVIKSVYSSFNNGAPQYEWSYEDLWLDASKNFTYKIVTRYMYNFIDANGGYGEFNEYAVDGNAVDDNGGTNGGDGNPIIEYAATDLGQVVAASSGTVRDIEEKVVDNTLYLGAITGADLYGKPALFRLNGSSWQNVWSTVPDVEFWEINFAISNTDSYLAGIRDSLCVFNWNGSSWSANLTPDNLGQEDSPSAISIEVLNDELYMAIEQHPQYDLQVMKYNGSSWETIGGDGSGMIASGSIFQTKLTNLNGTLYLHYRIDDVLHIMHLEGNSWVTDLAWEQEWLADIELTKTGSELYFSSGSASTDFDGGVYRVDNSSAVTNLIPDEHETWFTLGAFDLTSDSDGNLIVASMKYEYEDESQTSLISFPHLNVFDGSEWKTISGDFTDGVQPVGVNTIGNDIFYIYGDAATVNAVNDPSAIKSRKLTN